MGGFLGFTDGEDRDESVDIESTDEEEETEGEGGHVASLIQSHRVACCQDEEDWLRVVVGDGVTL